MPFYSISHFILLAIGDWIRTLDDKSGECFLTAATSPPINEVELASPREADLPSFFSSTASQRGDLGQTDAKQSAR